MPAFSAITYSRHAEQRMRKRRVTREDVELVIRIGDARYDIDDETWTFELGRLAVVIADRDDTAHVVTVLRLRAHT